jgi:glycerophosphoryl diester phosphodiesterase
MDKFIRKTAFIAFIVSSILSASLSGQQTPAARLNAMLDVRKSSVYVAAHRGDWRDAPENSIRSLKWASRIGVDIVEFDLKRTKDGQLVVMHDPTLNRTTTGSGLVSDHTLEKLKRLKLRAGMGHPTVYTIPTFAEELDGARENEMLLDIDQGGISSRMS